jgi:hypothetical protein
VRRWRAKHRDSLRSARRPAPSPCCATGRVGAQTLHRLAGGNSIVGGHEGKRDVVSDVHRSLLPIARSIEPASRVAGRDGRPKLVELGLEKTVGHQQRLDRLPGIAAAGLNGLVGGALKIALGGRSGFGAYKGKPLYTWKKDSAPGHTTGDGFNHGVWHMATP